MCSKYLGKDLRKNPYFRNDDKKFIEVGRRI